MHILGILDSISSGQYFLEDYDISSLPDKEQARIRNQHFGFIFQSFNLFPELSALENVMLPMSYAGVPWQERRKRAVELLDEVGLSHRMTHLPTMMSGGEQQRVAIARSLSNDPDLILADEPSGNLDMKSSRALNDLLWKLSRKYKKTFIIVTHNMELAHRSDSIIELYDGVIKSSNRQKIPDF
jgi:putative ABC transport system ATP-binding protein